MGKKNKKPKIQKLKDESLSGIFFDLEPDADAIFAAYLDREPDLEKLRHDQGSDAASLASSHGGRPKTPAGYSLDLHGMGLAEAIYHIDSRLRELLAGSAPIVQVKIITGKGLHSGPEGGVLAREIHAHVWGSFRKSIVRIDESPAAVAIDGIPLRGYFNVVLKRQGR